jgi:hypothetical protein
MFVFNGTPTDYAYDGPAILNVLRALRVCSVFSVFQLLRSAGLLGADRVVETMPRAIEARG